MWKKRTYFFPPYAGFKPPPFRKDVEPPENNDPFFRSARGFRRPICQYARLASRFGTSFRFRGENILLLDLDLPYRTTLDYEPPELAPQVVAALEAALQDEEDLELDGR